MSYMNNWYEFLAIVSAVAIVIVVLKFIISFTPRKDGERENTLVEENILIIRGLQVIGVLAETVAIAVKTGQSGTDLESALTNYKDFSKDLNDYLLKQNARSQFR